MNDQEFMKYLRDKEEIINLILKYATALDSRNWSLLDELFTHDVTTDYGGVQRSGVDAIKAMIVSHLGGCGPSQHLFSNFRVEVSGNKASAKFYGRVMHAGTNDQKDSLFDVWCEYQDELIRTENGWRTSFRRQVVFNATGDMSILK